MFSRILSALLACAIIASAVIPASAAPPTQGQQQGTLSFASAPDTAVQPVLEEPRRPDERILELTPVYEDGVPYEIYVYFTGDRLLDRIPRASQGVLKDRALRRADWRQLGISGFAVWGGGKDVTNEGQLRRIFRTEYGSPASFVRLAWAENTQA